MPHSFSSEYFFDFLLKRNRAKSIPNLIKLPLICGYDSSSEELLIVWVNKRFQTEPFRLTSLSTALVVLWQRQTALKLSGFCYAREPTRLKLHEFGWKIWPMAIITICMAAPASAASATFISLSSDCRRPSTWMGPDLDWFDLVGFLGGLQSGAAAGEGLFVSVVLRVLCAFNGYSKAKANAGLPIN